MKNTYSRIKKRILEYSFREGHFLNYIRLRIRERFFRISTTKSRISEKILGISRIKWINIEFVNYCNLRCIWCSLDHSKEKIIINEEILKTLLNNLINDKRFRHVELINLWNAGEILLHPDLEKILKILNQYRQTLILTKRKIPLITLLTNGMLLNERISKIITESEAIDKIAFSIDGGSREALERMRKGTKFDILKKNIEHFLKINKGKISTEIICIVEYGKEKNIDWMSNEFKELFNNIDNCVLRYPHNWDGSMFFEITKKANQYYKNKNFCYFLNYSLVLLPNGDITVCCVDLNSKGVIGNIMESSLFEISSSKQRKKMLNKLKRGKKKEIDLCKNCTGH
jgi:radical SAM protein with 4Fe4S-binding SPASM domain